MAKPSDHPGFQALLEEWNRRLKESGFVDLETGANSEGQVCRSGTQRRYELLNPLVRESRVLYFDQVQACVSRTVFKDEFEQKVLTLYAQGNSQAAIYRMLGVTGHRCKVYYPLYRWLRRWGLK